MKQNRSPLSWVVTVTAELLITIGAFLAGFVVWELWFTGLGAESDRQESLESFYEDLGSEQEDSGSDPDFEVCHTLADGTEVGCAETMRTNTGPDDIMGTAYVPRLGEDWAAPIRSGVSDYQIDRGGVGHYTTTNFPDEPGNFALAGHRNTYGSMLGDQDELVTGDAVYIVSSDGIYTYEVTERHVVTPTDNNALLEVPWEPGNDEPEVPVLTFTTCHPMFSNAERLIHHAKMVDYEPIGADVPEGLEYVDDVVELQEGSE